MGTLDEDRKAQFCYATQNSMQFKTNELFHSRTFHLKRACNFKPMNYFSRTFHLIFSALGG